ncbi:Hypp264 [Branchiostoma lanceolatum]|uniref:Hypp264 protein n=1 Tax=Branchiostoma lanceolatum TaxID=7740 RepID=A0A8J9VYE2_BRALA|nr:Hypp264 [Branchiostoma lanceolatum]
MATGRVQSGHVYYHVEAPVLPGRLSIAESLQDSNVYFSRHGITKRADSHISYVQFVPAGRERPNLEKIRRWQSSPSLTVSSRDRRSPVGVSPRGKGMKRLSPSVPNIEKDPDFFCQGMPLKRPPLNTKGDSPRPCSSLDSKGVVRLRMSDCTRFWSHHLSELEPTVRAARRHEHEWRQERAEVPPRYRLSRESLNEHDYRMNYPLRRSEKSPTSPAQIDSRRRESEDNGVTVRFLDKEIKEDYAMNEKELSADAHYNSRTSSESDDYKDTDIDAVRNGLHKTKSDKDARSKGTKQDEDFSSFNAAKVALVAKMHDLQDFISKTTGEADGPKELSSPRRGLKKGSTRSNGAPLRSLLNKLPSDFIMGHVGCHGDCGQCFQAALMPEGVEDSTNNK